MFLRKLGWTHPFQYQPSLFIVTWQLMMAHMHTFIEGYAAVDLHFVRRLINNKTNSKLLLLFVFPLTNSIYVPHSIISLKSYFVFLNARMPLNSHTFYSQLCRPFFVPKFLRLIHSYLRRSSVFLSKSYWGKLSVLWPNGFRLQVVFYFLMSLRLPMRVLFYPVPKNTSNGGRIKYINVSKIN